MASEPILKPIYHGNILSREDVSTFFSVAISNFANAIEINILH